MKYIIVEFMPKIETGFANQMSDSLEKVPTDLFNMCPDPEKSLEAKTSIKRLRRRRWRA